ncbi:hypothetical protein PYW08_006144 [Mythimna loreyi]|uniref:Uncharacterized protein n=1 Tax=Mythimna loreyi TaxID=667449 RepID=A0ACC2QNQ7_9NEOP|nr:hypothetical protein PYW08_006144 [Mythimna loreyi]
MKIRSQIEGQFYSLISEGQCILDKLEVNAKHKSLVHQSFRQSGSFESADAFTSSIKLPTIKLSTFDGTYSKWLEYRDTYDALIHKHENIDPINKLHYLRSSLEGSAALIINLLSFCSDNYILAYDLLCQRFNNTRLLISNHMKALFNKIWNVLQGSLKNHCVL